MILDFGGQRASLGGTKAVFGGHEFSNTEIRDLSYAFAQGYYSCDTTSGPENNLFLGIGTNNSYHGVSVAGGESWGKNVATVAGWVLESPSMTSEVAIAGADDLEVGYSPGGAAFEWMIGYSFGTESLYFDYGDAAGCPTSSHSGGECTGGEPGWDQDMEFLLAWVRAVPTPEIYYNPPPGSPANADQWAEIARFAEEAESECMYSLGPLDQDGAEESNTATQAYSQYSHAIETIVEVEPFTTHPPYCVGMTGMPSSLEI